MKIFEQLLLRVRFITFLAVIFSLLGAIIIFVVASYDVFGALLDTWHHFIIGDSGKSSSKFHDDILSAIIGAIDFYLMALVLLIFSFGIYELFICEIKDAKEKGLSVLEVHSIDELKDKLAKVIIMVLIVKFFQKVMYIKYETPIDMFYLAGAIFLIALGFYFLNKDGKH
ncbi:MAG: YqhA family protein [Campylobacteraceae bacterium]|nr:YqhA family protein [Campylobacteraceae bacterium]